MVKEHSQYGIACSLADSDKTTLTEKLVVYIAASSAPRVFLEEKRRVTENDRCCIIVCRSLSDWKQVHSELGSTALAVSSEAGTGIWGEIRREIVEEALRLSTR